MATPTVSIIVPAYNHGAYLTLTINSALVQTWRDFEVIVVDDGSKDNTPEVAASFGDAITFIRQENKGMAGSRNTGIRHARGEFIAFLDDDDLWEPEYLAHVIPALQRDPSLGACRAGFRIMDSNGVRLPQQTTRQVAPDRMYDALLDGGFFPPCTVTARKACFDELGVFDTNLQGLADWDMWIRISRVHGFLSLPETLVLYRVHPSGLSANVEHMAEDRFKAIGKHFGPEEGDAASWSAERRRVYSGAHLNTALAYYQRGDPARNDAGKGDEQLAIALRLRPALVERLDLFYELALSNQPRGYRGQIEGLDVRHQADAMMARVEPLLEQTPGMTPALKRAARGNAYLALSMLADQAGDWALARSYLRGAATANPALLKDPAILRRMAKLAAGKQFAATARGRSN
jgi:glycosyltransferase involved in cell wall biosynthesis